MCEVGKIIKLVEMCNTCKKYEVSCIGSDEQQEICYKKLCEVKGDGLMTDIIQTIEQLEIYTTNKVQEWKEIMRRPSNSEEQDRVATAVWETYRDMANKIADLGELAEKQNLLNLNNVKKAFVIANNAIYFNDNSDFLTALYQVCKTLNPEIEDELIGSKYIEED